MVRAANLAFQEALQETLPGLSDRATTQGFGSWYQEQKAKAQKAKAIADALAGYGELMTNGWGHIPGYNYCGPGTQVDNAEGDPINDLDWGCYHHDIAWNKAGDGDDGEANRIAADKVLKNVAEKFKDAAEDYSLDWTNGYLVYYAMVTAPGAWFG